MYVYDTNSNLRRPPTVISSIPVIMHLLVNYIYVIYQLGGLCGRIFSKKWAKTTAQRKVISKYCRLSKVVKTTFSLSLLIRLIQYTIWEICF